MKSEHPDHHRNPHSIGELAVRFRDLLGKTPIECGPGWYAPLLELFSYLFAAGVRGTRQHASRTTANSVRFLRPMEPSVLQVKEKLGGLRVYLSASTPETERAIRWVEHVCAETCDQCGNPGRLRRLGGQLATRCEAHLMGIR